MYRQFVCDIIETGMIKILWKPEGSNYHGIIDLMKEKARQNRKTIVLPESEDQRTLTGAAQILKEGTADLILVGNAETIKKDAAALNADIEGVKIVDPENRSEI